MVFMGIMLALLTTPAGKELDFWIGDWNVYVEGQLAGTDSVTAEMNGYVIKEIWRGAEAGDTGESFFYYMPEKRQWKQIWITGRGPYKEKLSTSVPGGVRFTGKVFLPDGRAIADRTTLTPNVDGTVHQVIEQSKDGRTWKVGFDAVYRKIEVVGRDKLPR